jgi:endonuclease YncB( thermonuclease family)
MLPTMRSLLLLIAVVLALPAVEGDATVIQALSGNSIQVIARLGAGDLPLVIRLGYIRAPEGPQPALGQPWKQAGAVAQALLSTRLMAGTRIRLVGPGTSFRVDDDGRLLALVYKEGAKVSVQELLISAGAAAYDHQFHRAPGESHATLLAAQEQARAGQTGAWRTLGEWMANGTVAPPDPAALNRARPVTAKEVIRRDGIAGLPPERFAWGETWVCPECEEILAIGEMVCEDCGYILNDAEMRKLWVKKSSP